MLRTATVASARGTICYFLMILCTATISIKPQTPPESNATPRIQYSKGMLSVDGAPAVLLTKELVVYRKSRATRPATWDRLNKKYFVKRDGKRVELQQVLAVLFSLKPAQDWESAEPQRDDIKAIFGVNREPVFRVERADCILLICATRPRVLEVSASNDLPNKPSRVFLEEPSDSYDFLGVFLLSKKAHAKPISIRQLRFSVAEEDLLLQEYGTPPPTYGPCAPINQRD